MVELWVMSFFFFVSLNFSQLIAFTDFKDFIFLFLEKGEGREKERERNINCLSLACLQLGTWPTTQACALTGNRTGDLLVYRMTPIHWATPVRYAFTDLKLSNNTTIFFLNGMWFLSHSPDYRENWSERWAQDTNMAGVQHHLRMCPSSWFSAGWTQWEWCHFIRNVVMW